MFNMRGNPQPNEEIERELAFKPIIVGRRANCDRPPVSFEGIDQGCLGRLT